MRPHLKAPRMVTVMQDDCGKSYEGIEGGSEMPNGEGRVTNEMRAEWAAQIFDLSPFDEDEPEVSVVDVLADLMHYCNREGFDFGLSLGMAQMHFAAELLGEI